MERIHQQRAKKVKGNSRSTLAWVLIGIGLIFLLNKTGFYVNFPDFHLSGIFASVVDVFRSIIHCFFSWPFILLVIGVILLAGKRSGGWLLFFLGVLFILPKIFILSGLVMFILFPIVLIVLGITLIIRLL